MPNNETMGEASEKIRFSYDTEMNEKLLENQQEGMARAREDYAEIIDSIHMPDEGSLNEVTPGNGLDPEIAKARQKEIFRRINETDNTAGNNFNEHLALRALAVQKNYIPPSFRGFVSYPTIEKDIPNPEFIHYAVGAGPRGVRLAAEKSMTIEQREAMHDFLVETEANAQERMAENVKRSEETTGTALTFDEYVKKYPYELDPAEHTALEYVAAQQRKRS